VLCVKSRRAAWSVECARASELTPKGRQQALDVVGLACRTRRLLGATHERFEVMAAGSAPVLVERHSKVKGKGQKASD